MQKLLKGKKKCESLILWSKQHKLRLKFVWILGWEISFHSEMKSEIFSSIALRFWIPRVFHSSIRSLKKAYKTLIEQDQEVIFSKGEGNNLANLITDAGCSRTTNVCVLNFIVTACEWKMSFWILCMRDDIFQEAANMRRQMRERATCYWSREYGSNSE